MIGRVEVTKPAVLIFTGSFRRGGSERQAVELARGLASDGYPVILACFDLSGPLQSELPDDLHSVQHFPLIRFAHPLTVYQAARFIRLLRRDGVRVVQCFDFYSNLFAIPLARAIGVPVVMGARREEGVTRSRLQRALEHWCLKRANGVVTNAKRLREQLARGAPMKRDRIVVIPNILHLDTFDRLAAQAQRASADQENVRIGVIANLRPEKGHLIFVRAAALLAERAPNVRFVIAGDGPERARIESAAAAAGLGEKFTFLGEVLNVPALLRGIDIVVLPSLSNEGVPNAVMEAMAGRRPVVATDTGGTADLVQDGESGFIVPPGDEFELFRTMETLCANVDMRVRMGAAGRKRIEDEFSGSMMVAAFERTYVEHLRASEGSDHLMAAPAVD